MKKMIKGRSEERKMEAYDSESCEFRSLKSDSENDSFINKKTLK